jgi:hypothetical protein
MKLGKKNRGRFETCPYLLANNDLHCVNKPAIYSKNVTYAPPVRVATT